MARQQLNFIYMPPDVRGTPAPRVAPSPAIRVDPRVLRKIAPGEIQPLPGPKVPEHVVRNEAPVEAPPELPPPQVPQTQASSKPPDFLRGTIEEPKPQPSPAPPLTWPHSPTIEFAGPFARRVGGRRVARWRDHATVWCPGPGGGGPGGGGGQGLGGALEMLTPTEGVDFTNYLARVVASVKRNWFSIMPESARLGDRGRVILQFRIMRNGSVPDAEPQLMGTSRKEPLDRAALSSIRASSPFEPLPPAFSGPYIELRFIFLYNMPLNAQ